MAEEISQKVREFVIKWRSYFYSRHKNVYVYDADNNRAAKGIEGIAFIDRAVSEGPSFLDPWWVGPLHPPVERNISASQDDCNDKVSTCLFCGGCDSRNLFPDLDRFVIRKFSPIISPSSSSCQNDELMRNTNKQMMDSWRNIDVERLWHMFDELQNSFSISLSDDNLYDLLQICHVNEWLVFPLFPFSL